MRTLQFRGAQLDFPRACACCLGPAHKFYLSEKTFIYGRQSRSLTLLVPMCDRHLAQASASGWLQTLLERLSVWIGALTGVLVAGGLFNYWMASGSTNLWVNIPLALVVGACFFVSAWALVLFYVAPLFKPAAARRVADVVRMTRFDPFRGLLNVQFENETFGELTARANPRLLVVEPDRQRLVQISAHIQDDDIRLSGRLETRVLLAGLPTQAEALALLAPAIELCLVQQGGKDTFYAVDAIEMVELDDWGPAQG